MIFAANLRTGIEESAKFLLQQAQVYSLFCLLLNSGEVVWILVPVSCFLPAIRRPLNFDLFVAIIFPGHVGGPGMQVHMSNFLLSFVGEKQIE